jgi:hypothetical protein
MRVYSHGVFTLLRSMRHAAHCGLNQPTVCSTDLERSQDFHENKVGLRLSPVTIKNSLVFECGDSTTLLVYGRPSPNEADHTRPADSP